MLHHEVNVATTGITMVVAVARHVWLCNATKPLLQKGLKQVVALHELEGILKIAVA